jgi:hypothetical protein
MAATIEGEVGKGAPLDECPLGEKIYTYTASLSHKLAVTYHRLLKPPVGLIVSVLLAGSWLEPAVLSHCRLVV